MKLLYKNKMNSIIGYLILSFLFLLFFSPYTSILNDYFGIDTAQYWVIGQGILRGKVPYIDLFDHKGPMIFFVWALGILIGRGTKIGILLLQTVALFAGLWYLHKLAEVLGLTYKKEFICLACYLILLCGTIVEGGLTEEWALPCGIYTIFIGVCYFKNLLEKPIWIYAGILGILFSFVVWMRVNNGALMGAVLLTLFLHLLFQKQYKKMGQCTIAFLIGVMIISGPILLYFAYHHALYDLYYGSIVYNTMYASGGFFGKTTKEIIKIFLYEGITLLFLVWKIWKDHSVEVKWENVLLILTTLVTGMSCMLGYTWQHYFMLFLPCIIVVGMYTIRDTSMVKAMTCLLILILPYSWQIVRNAGKNVLFTFWGYYDDTFEEIRRIRNIIPEDEQDGVWSIGWTTSKYFAANEISPCFKVFDFPMVLEISKELRADTEKMLQEEPPLWIMRFANDHTDYIEGLSVYIETNYEMVVEITNSSDETIHRGQSIDLELWRHK